MPFLEFLPGSAYLLYSIVAAGVLVYLPFLVVGYGRFQAGYDTTAPRAMLDKLPPYAQRATWAHQNAFEAFALFSVAALMAFITQQDSTLAIAAAIAHVIARLFYPLFYILNIPILRSLMFGIGSLGTGVLFALSLISVSSP